MWDGPVPSVVGASPWTFQTENRMMKRVFFAINKNAALSFTSTFGDWTTTVYAAQYSETEFARDQDEIPAPQKPSSVFGNLGAFALSYAALAQRTIDLRLKLIDSYNGLTQNEGHHFFWAFPTAGRRVGLLQKMAGN